MTTIIAINGTDADHLETVTAAMREMGAPEIRAFWTGELWLALEGSHRLAAAAALGLTPTLIEMDEADEMVCDIDMPDEDGYSMDGRTVRVASILAAIDQSGPLYQFED
jgi:hypothetical protein